MKNPGMLTPRAQSRLDTMERIVAAARERIRAGEEFSFRAVASDVGLSGPGLYRYVASLQDLRMLVGSRIADDAIAFMERAVNAHPVEDSTARILAAAVAFRCWALRNAVEYRFSFAAFDPLHTGRVPSDGEVRNVPQRMAAFFAPLFVKALLSAKTPPELTNRDRVEFARAGEVPSVLGGEVTPEDEWILKRAWTSLYGLISLEVFGQVSIEYVSSAALFRAVLGDLFDLLGAAGEWERVQPIIDEGCRL